MNVKEVDGFIGICIDDVMLRELKFIIDTNTKGMSKGDKKYYKKLIKASKIVKRHFEV